MTQPTVYIVADAIATAYWIDDGQLFGCALNADGSPDFEADFLLEDVSREETEKISEAIGTIEDLVELTLAAEAPPQLVKLAYFKRNGKFYDHGELNVGGHMELFHIWEHVRELRKRGHLPGLVTGAGMEFLITVDAPGHRNEHPHLLTL